MSQAVPARCSGHGSSSGGDGSDTQHVFGPRVRVGAWAGNERDIGTKEIDE